MFSQLGSGGPPPGSSCVPHTAGGLQDLRPLTRPLSVGCSISRPQPQPGRAWFCLRSMRCFRPRDVYYVSGTEASMRPSKKKKKKTFGEGNINEKLAFPLPSQRKPWGLGLCPDLPWKGEAGLAYCSRGWCCTYSPHRPLNWERALIIWSQLINATIVGRVNDSLVVNSLTVP